MRLRTPSGALQRGERMAFETYGVEVGQLWRVVRSDGDGLVISITGFSLSESLYFPFPRVQFLVEKGGLGRHGDHHQTGARGSMPIKAFLDGRLQRVKAIYNHLFRHTEYV